MLSSAARAYCDDKLMSIAEADAGAIRTGNEATACSHSAQFKYFCSSIDHSDLSFSSTTQNDAESILASFAIAVSTGEFSASRKPVALKSVKNHVLAAASFAINASRKDPRFRYDQFGNKIGDRYFPALQLVYQSMSKWKKKSSKALPLSPAIISHLVTIASLSPQFSESACIRDAVILGCFTGSRCGEYCSGKAHKGDAFGKVPHNILTAEFAGWPIAFCSADFYFLNATHHIVPWTDADSAGTMVRIRFRYDKGGGCNFSERTFHKVSCDDPALSFLCPVKTCFRILLRWSSISNNPLSPVFCWRESPKSKHRFLADIRVTAALRTAVTAMYPDPTHLYRVNIKDVRTHSVRVYACLALNDAGLSHHEIEYKLRWASKAWMVYLRENMAKIPSQTLAVFLAAFVTEHVPENPRVPSLLDEDVDDGN